MPILVRRNAHSTARALERALGSTDGNGDRALRDTIQELCAEARRAGLRPEELIVLVKATWRSRPELGTVSHGEPNPALDRVITMCIEEYYRTAASH